MPKKIVTLPKINTQKRSDLVYKILYEEIVRGKYPAGYKLDLNDIEQQLGISRTPLKLALHRLELEGLVEIKAQYGTFVTTPTPEQIIEAFGVRIMIETFIIDDVIKKMTDSDFLRLSRIIDHLNSLEESGIEDEVYIRLMEMDRDFHRSLVSLAGNKTILKIYDNADVYPYITRVLFHVKERDLKVAKKEHAVIIEELRKRDGEGVRQAIILHCKRSEKSTLNALKYYREN
ncbi:MAG: GntR family transcriptional regulator [Spirochaetales bacterium]|nr:GntR family transcriptional regulator [Spirochaetales bacterium]